MKTEETSERTYAMLWSYILSPLSSGCHPRRKPFLKMMHRKGHKHLAEDKQTKDMDYWNHVLWWWECHGLGLHECCQHWGATVYWGNHECQHALWYTEAEQDPLPSEYNTPNLGWMGWAGDPTIKLRLVIRGKNVLHVWSKPTLQLCRHTGKKSVGLFLTCTLCACSKKCTTTLHLLQAILHFGPEVGSSTKTPLSHSTHCPMP